ncbi:MAG: hypothetical protein AAFZ15_24685, partial [Bacteroidota bacterium]
LKGVSSLSSKDLSIRKVLVLSQFVLSFTMIVAAYIFYQQINFIQSKSLGYNKNNLLQFEIEGKVKENTETFLDELQNIKGVINTSSIGHSLVSERNNYIIDKWEGQPENQIAFEMLKSLDDNDETPFNISLGLNLDSINAG